MLLEGLVVAACLNGKGCSQSTDAYYKANPELQRYVQNLEEYSKKLVNETFAIYVIAPAYALTTGQPAQIILTNRLTLQVEVREPNMAIRWNY